MLDELQRRAVRFIVAGRISNPGVGDGTFLTLEKNLTVPHGYEAIFVGLSETEFRLDLSSSMLRAKLNEKNQKATRPKDKASL